MNTPKANWALLEIDTVRWMIFIVDMDIGGKSITNDADNVCAQVIKRINPSYHLYRLFYRDTMGKWDELLHDRGTFKGFAPGLGITPK